MLKENVSVVADMVQELNIKEIKPFIKELWKELNQRELEGFEFKNVKELKKRFPKEFSKIKNEKFKINPYMDRIFLGKYFLLILHPDKNYPSWYNTYFYPAFFDYKKKKIEFFTRKNSNGSTSPVDRKGRIYMYSQNGCVQFLKRISSIRI